MRISDWSSDVCSSDLHQRIANRQEIFADDHQPRFGQQEMDVRDAAMQRIFDRDHRAIGAAILHGFDRVGEIETRQRQTVGKGLRSEEHTSELQSLMRNSYAVFCLKKKKTTQTKYTNT